MTCTFMFGLKRKLALVIRSFTVISLKRWSPILRLVWKGSLHSWYISLLSVISLNRKSVLMITFLYCDWFEREVCTCDTFLYCDWFEKEVCTVIHSFPMIDLKRTSALVIHPFPVFGLKRKSAHMIHSLTVISLKRKSALLQLVWKESLQQ